MPATAPGNIVAPRRARDPDHSEKHFRASLPDRSQLRVSTHLSGVSLQMRRCPSITRPRVRTKLLSTLLLPVVLLLLCVQACSSVTAAAVAQRQLRNRDRQPSQRFQQEPLVDTLRLPTEPPLHRVPLQASNTSSAAPTIRTRNATNTNTNDERVRELRRVVAAAAEQNAAFQLRELLNVSVQLLAKQRQPETFSHAQLRDSFTTLSSSRLPPSSSATAAEAAARSSPCDGSAPHPPLNVDPCHSSAADDVSSSVRVSSSESRRRKAYLLEKERLRVGVEELRWRHPAWLRQMRLAVRQGHLQRQQQQYQQQQQQQQQQQRGVVELDEW